MTPARLGVASAAVVVAALLLDAVLLGSFSFVEIAPARLAFRPAEGAVAGWRERAARERAEPPRAEAVTLVILDGVRLDVSREMPALQALRARGREAVLVAPFPSFTRVGYGALLTGAPPTVHGYVSNGFRHPSPVESVVDLARRAGWRVRFLGAGGQSVSWIPRMFPGAFDETLGIDRKTLRYERAAAERTFDIVYVPDPDDAGHEHGGTSAEYRASAREVDRALGELVARLDLERGAVIVATDHGHIDQGGHGGHEAVVRRIPCIVAGRGTDRAALRDGEPLEVVARELARLLGVRPPPPLVEARAPVGARPFFALVAVGAIAALVRLRDRRAALMAVLALGVFHVLYVGRGHPLSFSIINDPRLIPLFAGEVVVLGILAILAARTLGPTPAFLPATLALAVAYAAAAGAIAGPSAPSAIHAPAAAYVYQLALAYAVAVGAACVAAAILARWKSRRKKSVPCSPTTTP